MKRVVNLTLQLLAVLLLVALVLAPALLDIPTVKGQADAPASGLVPNKPLYDNGQALNEWIATKPTLPLIAGGGVYYAQTPAALGKRDGLELDFQGQIPWSRVGRPMDASAVTYVYQGNVRDEAGKLLPAIHSRGHNTIFAGLNLWRSFYGDVSARDGTTGLLLTDPASSTHFVCCTFAGWENAITLGKSTHVECLHLENIKFTACLTCIRNEEPQAVGHHLENIEIQAGCGTFWHSPVVPPGRVGGGLSLEINTLSATMPVLLFDLPKTSGNGYGVRVTNLKVDPNARGWRLVDHSEGPLDLYVRGGMGLNAAPALDAIDVGDAAKVDVRLAWRGRYWPEDFEIRNGEWEPRE